MATSCDGLIQLKRLDEALASCSRVTAVMPDSPIGFYNLAGVYALLGREAEALAALDRDLELGDTDWEYLAGDQWFEGLRGNPRFAAIVQEMKQRTN